MIQIKRIFTNHFDSPFISDNRLKAFSEDHINKLSGWLQEHADAELSTMLTELVGKHNEYFGAITNEIAKFNYQQSQTISVDEAWEKVLDFIRYAEGVVIFKWGQNSGVYQEFFPQGITEYTRATKLTKETVLTQFLNAANNHTADLPPNFTADFATFKNDWKTKFTAQQQQIGLVKDANSQTATVRQPVEEQLAKHVLVLALKNIGKPEMVNDFFNESLLRPRRRSETIPAHTVILKGTVTSDAVAQPNIQVRLLFPGSIVPVVVTTNAEGKFTYKADNIQQPGNVHITVDAPGYQHYEQLLFVEPGKEYTVPIGLQQGLARVA